MYHNYLHNAIFQHRSTEARPNLYLLTCWGEMFPYELFEERSTGVAHVSAGPH